MHWADQSAVLAPVVRFREVNASLNADIEHAFASGAAAVVLLAEHLMPNPQAVAALREAGVGAPGAVISGTVASSSHPQLLLGQGHWWSQDDSCWHEQRCVKLLRRAAAPALDPADSITAAAVFIPAAVWHLIGPFDLRFGRWLADLDWSVRARTRMVKLMRAEGACFLAGASQAPDQSEQLRSSFLLARKHGLPSPAWRLAWQRIALTAERELSIVRYMTDESRRVSRLKRVAWYLANLARALRRERFRRSIAQTWRALRAQQPEGRQHRDPAAHTFRFATRAIPCQQRNGNSRRQLAAGLDRPRRRRPGGLWVRTGNCPSAGGPSRLASAMAWAAQRRGAATSGMVGRQSTGTAVPPGAFVFQARRRPVFHVPSAPLMRQLQQLAERADLIWVERLYAALPLSQYAYKTVVDLDDLESVKVSRQAEQAESAFARHALYREAARLAAAERAAARSFRHVAVCSLEDTASFGADCARAWVIANGVDDALMERPATTRDPFGLVFVGTMNYAPNIDAVLYFCREVLPRIRAQVPAATLTIVGLNPTDPVRALADGHSVFVQANVPEVAPYVQSATVSVVPLRVGGGTRLKILESLALGTPVVSTTVGAEGLHLAHGEHLLLADSAPGMTEAVIRCLQDVKLRTELSAAGRQRVSFEYRWSAIRSLMSAQCRGLVEELQSQKHTACCPPALASNQHKPKSLS